MGQGSGGHHLTNLLLHGLNSGLVVLFVWMLLENVGASFGERVALAGGVALVFGLHPLQVEPVAWVAERKTVLCAFFSLMSLCAYLQMTRQPSSRAWRWVMTLLFAAALLGKPMAMSLPLVMLALDFCPLRRHETVGWWRLWKEKALLIGLSAVDLVLTVIGQARSGAVMAMQAHSVGERCLAAARGVHLLFVEADLAGMAVSVLSAGRNDVAFASGVSRACDSGRFDQRAGSLAQETRACVAGGLVRLPRAAGSCFGSDAGGFTGGGGPVHVPGDARAVAGAGMGRRLVVATHACGRSVCVASAVVRRVDLPCRQDAPADSRVAQQ